MATAGYTRPQTYSSIRDDDDEALDIQIDSDTTRSSAAGGVKKLHGQVQEVVGVMKKNIDKLLDRDVALNNLMTRADDLETSASTYNQTTKQLRRKYWWKNAKTNICIAGIVVGVILIIIIAIAFNRRGKK
ncbi:unnamed protein product [Rotaria magnacalcarata]|uniref:V-SNARE coiled-coil homology domain-containing protein n=2 Tax=Rotaria magnacalcarata TaxID=392030 RepID=A0A816MK48_9BILA|nr:unnamed protein product [Rotaria magnacalcarata]CAF1425334.1 unnamed protein product [Rotaria magnacalcarata]CAF1977228.1 unnamed protein product [Rotaria magnacalcarata]CAF2003006.1 unnamed protein product [Rotaria magnacalcarata]CAF2100360.1 unnamed protein product [Rotaria magnacalcarata]